MHVDSYSSNGRTGFHINGKKLLLLFKRYCEEVVLFTDTIYLLICMYRLLRNLIWNHLRQFSVSSKAVTAWKSKGEEKTNCVNYYLLRYNNLNLLGILLFQTGFNLPKVFHLISKEKSGIENKYTIVWKNPKIKCLDLAK